MQSMPTLEWKEERKKESQSQNSDQEIVMFNLTVLPHQNNVDSRRDEKAMEKASAAQPGYRKYWTHPLAQSSTPAHGNSKWTKMNQRKKANRKDLIIKCNCWCEIKKSMAYHSSGLPFPTVATPRSHGLIS